MTIRTKGRPLSEESAVDRGRTIELVRRTGRQKLVFTVQDVRREMGSDQAPNLLRPDRLSNHVAALEGTVVRLVGQGRMIPGTKPTARAKRRYVLIEREREFEAGYRTLDDAERVLVALHLAVQLAGGEAVPTSAVTSVIKAVPDLMPTSDSPTASHLQNLATSAQPSARLESVTGQVGQLWLPVGEAPEHPNTAVWLEQAKKSEAYESGLLELGIANLSRLAEELVRLGVRAYARSWPGGGRPVTADEILAAARACEEGRRLLNVLKRKEVTLGAILGDASRTRVDGRPRKRSILIKVPNRWSETVYYDVPHDPGYEQRAEFLEYQGIVEHTDGPALSRLTSEARQAKRLLSAELPAHRGFGAARLALVRGRWEELLEALQRLKYKGLGLLRRQRRLLSERLETLEAHQRVLPVLDPSHDIDLEAYLTDCDLDLHTVITAPRPILIAPDLVHWVPRALRPEMSPGRFLGNLPGFTRYPNPHYVGPNSGAPEEDHRVGVDRVEVLTHLAERITSPLATGLRRVRTALGPDLRCPRILSRLYSSGSMEAQRTALLGLALIGADDAVRRYSFEIMENLAVPLRLAEAAVYAMLITRQLREEDVKSWMDTHGRPDLRGLLQPARRYARAGVWLMKG
jgi:hypothetical protein